MDWNTLFVDIVKYFLSISVITAGIAYVIKTIFKLYMDRNLEKYKIELGKEINIEIEKAKREFDRLNKENEIKFSRLHKERANAIKELYKRLVEVEICIRTFYSQNFEKFNRYYKPNIQPEGMFSSISNFVEFYELNKILFSDEAYKALSILHDAFNLIYLSNTEMLEDIKNNQDLQKGLEQILNSIIPGQKELLEKEFKKSIGVT